MHRAFCKFLYLLSLAFSVTGGTAAAAGPLNIVRLMPDPMRPRLYAISSSGKEQGAILVIDTLTKATIQTIPVGKEPTDFDLTENSAELLVMNTTDRSISRINLATLAVTATHQLTQFENRNEDFGGHVVDGPGNILYYVDEQWGPRLRVYDTVTGTVLQTFGATTTGNGNDYGFGDVVVNPGKTDLFGWVQYGDGAGWAGSFVVRYAIASNGTLTLADQGRSDYPTPLNREPFDTPALMTADGSRLVIKNRVVDLRDADLFPITYPNNIYSISPNGKIVATSTTILPGAGGEILHTLPVAATVQAILPDYSAMAYFNSTTQQIVWLDLIKTLGNTALGLKIEPGDGMTVANPTKLEWFPVTGISRYQLYLGTTRSGVEAATPTSPTYLGETGGTTFALTAPLVSGQSYFWRVVPVGADGLPAGTGTTRSFQVANLAVSQNSITAESVEGVRRHVESIQLTAATPQPWSATADVPWITLEAASGSTPGNLVAVLNASTLAAGTHAGKITLTSGGATIAIPVSLKLYAANYMISETDLELPWVYLVSQESNNSGQPSFLIRVDTATNQIESAVACGRSVTDLAIHYQENRIYLTNWQTGILRAFDRGSFKQVQTYQFAPVGPIGYGEGGIWRVAAGKKGRLILEEADQWIDMRLINTATGAVVANNSSEYAGDGEADPTGRYYYHSGLNEMTRYDLAADTFVEMPPAGTPGGSSVTMIADGSKIASGTRVFDAKLGFQFALPAEVRGGTLHGDLLFTETKAYNGNNGLELATLPGSASVMSVTGDQKKLYLFPANSKNFLTVDLSTIATLPSRDLTPTVADGSKVIGTKQTLDWSIEPFATSYRIYFGTSRTAVTNATETSAEYLGTSATDVWTGTLPALALGGEYFWRVDVIGYSGSRKGAVWSFSVAPLDVSPAKLEVVLPMGSPLTSRTLAISGPAGSAWTATTSTPWLSVPSGAGTTPGTLTVGIDVTGLPVGVRQGSVTITSGTASWSLPVAVEVLALNYTVAQADLEAPYIYAISQAASGTDDRAFLVVINTLTNAISKVVPVGRSATDLSVHYPENRIYISNWQSGKLLALDRTTLAEVRTYSYGAAGGYGTNSGDVYKVAAGRSGRLVIEQQDQWVNFFLIDTASGNKLATGYAREGGGVFDPTGRYYYHGENNSSGAEIQRYDTGSNAFTEIASKRVSGFNYYGSRRILTSGDGSRVFWNGGVFDPALNVLLQLTNEVVSSTYRGEVLFTDKAAVNGVNAETLATLPVTTSIQAISADQNKLFLFKAGAFSVVDIATIAKVSPRGLIPGIADGSAVIGTTQALTWSQEATALSYDVYFGTSAAAVSAATQSSPEFLGNTPGTRWTGAMPVLEYGRSYWWRVDIAGFNSSLKGATWSFKIPLINVVPQVIDLAYPTASPIPVQRLALTSPAGGSVAWTASTATPWISLKSTSGTAPGNLDFAISSAGLTAGLKEGSIAFSVGGDTFHVPVRLRILALNITKLVAHPARPIVYGINTAAAGEGFSHLLEIDASTALILRSMPIGFSPTDADLDATRERLYVSNWGYSSTRVIDVANWSELPSLAIGDDVFKLEITPDGKLVTEEQDQWIDLSLWNASTGQKLNSATSVREGDGEADPTGQFYYHSDNNSSGAVVTKYNITGNSFVSVATGPQIGYGSRNLILSGNGSKLFWLGRVLDANLKLLGQMPGEVHATTGTGDLAVGPAHVWWSDSGTLVTALPFTSTVAAISANDADLVRFNPLTKTLHSTSLKDFTDLPGPYPRPDQVLDASPARLSWSPVAGATSYRVFIAPDATALVAMTSPVAIVLTNYYDLPSPLAFGKSYAWRVDVVTGSATNTGKIRSFSIRFPEGTPLPATATDSQGISASISDRHLLVGSNGSAQLYEFNPTTGAAMALQKFTLDAHYTQHYFGSSVAVDAGKASIGAYSFDTPLSGNGSVFLYRSGDSGAWESSGPLSLPKPVSNESFGRGLAASGNLMLAGTAYASGKVGRVAAYITEPTTTQMQVFSAGDPVAGDGFGQVIAMAGNQAIISAPGSGPSFNRLPSLYSFTRSISTGLWSQRQKIAIPGATSSSSGSVLALSEKYLATNCTTTASVEIFTKNDSGQWIPSASIKQSTVPGSSSSSFGKALAISGDQLFIGDAGATSQGTSGGAVFSFRRSGAAWIAGPAITPRGSYSGFGGVLALRDGWLLATGNAKPGWLFRVDNTANQTPRFPANVPTQVVAGREFTTEIRAEDADGNKGLVLDLLQGPSWLKLTDNADGKAILSGVPTGLVDSVDTVQLRVRDSVGAQALHTYQLTTLAATSLPVLTLEPSGLSAGEGQEVVLRAAVSGIGPFTWQWHRDGQPVPGATRSTLVFGEIALGDTGSYTVSVANVVGQDESGTAAIKVHPANRFAGDWPTFGGSTRHAGYHPARLGRHGFVPAWAQVIHPTNALNRVAVADRRVFVSASSRFETSPSINALDLADGKVLWTEPIASSNSINPPSWHNGTVYFQRGKGVSDAVGPQLIALDASSGKRKWASVFGAQWESYEAPAVTDGGVWINGGTYGGMYGFTLAGSQTFFRSMAQYDGWTPTVSNGRLFSWVAGLFQEHNPADGSTLWSVDATWDWRGWSVNNVSAISGTSAAVISTTEIVCIDLSSRSIRWRKSGFFQGSPAISGGWVYGIQDKTVTSYSLADGTPGPVVTLPESIVSGQPLLLMDYLLVASAANTFVVDRATGAIVHTLPGGGLLSFAHGRLFAAGTDGTLRAWSVNGGLEFTSDHPPVVANPQADPGSLDLAPLVKDTDGQVIHQWEIDSNSNPAIFSTMWVDQNGRLDFAFAPYVSGSSDVTVMVRNALGSFASTTIRFTLPKPPAPSVRADAAIRLNRATGLYEQKVTVKNIAARAIAGFDLTISGLRSGSVLHNGSSTTKGGGVFSYNKPMTVGESVVVVLKYYASIRGAIHQPLIRASVAGPSATAKSRRMIAAEKPFSITRSQVQADRSMLLEFPAEPGRNYRIHYSADALHWKACPEIISDAGTKIQWIDRGPPWTDSAPASTPTRFYRIERLDR